MTHTAEEDLAPPKPWSLASKIAFRFAVAYFTFYVIVTQMLGGLVIPADFPPLERLPPFRPLIEWTTRHVFHITTPLVEFSGSGDKTFDWVQAFVFLCLACLTTVVWSVLDRRRQHYDAAHRWFRVFLRFALGATMIDYGSVKAVPLQMPSPQFTRLVEPYGNFSPMGVLWYQVGSSFGFEMAVGCMELLGGALLFLPGTALLGALVCLVDATFIFLLNMTFDVPVKLFSFHLILMSLVLIAPDVPRLFKVLFNRRVDPRPVPKSRRPWLTVGVQAVYSAYIVTMFFISARKDWYEYGGGAPHSPLYGIWNIDSLTENGVERAPLVTDRTRLRRFIAEMPDGVAFQLMDDSFRRYGAKFDAAGTSFSLLNEPSSPPIGSLAYSRPASGQLVFDGTLDGKRLHMELREVPLTSFLLRTRGFNWVQERPFNR